MARDSVLHATCLRRHVYRPFSNCKRSSPPLARSSSLCPAISNRRVTTVLTPDQEAFMPTTATHIWKPSTARTIVLNSFIPIPRGSASAAPPTLSWPMKDPTDVLDYRFDIGPALVGNDGDAIATIDVTIAPADPGDLTVNSVKADGNIAVLWLSAGQTGVVYTIIMTITTLNGRTINRGVILPVLYLSVGPSSPSVLTTDGGLIITDENGNPIAV